MGRPPAAASSKLQRFVPPSSMCPRAMITLATITSALPSSTSADGRGWASGGAPRTAAKGQNRFQRSQRTASA
eukprot:12157044-Alexandrium_andersonii.AAC.1